MTTKKTIRLKCPRKECGYEWNYGGKSKWYTSCPRCKMTVHVERHKVDKENN